MNSTRTHSASTLLTHEDVFLSRSREILQQHFGRVPCSNGCKNPARFYTISATDRMLFCGRCAKNLDQQDFKTEPLGVDIDVEEEGLSPASVLKLQLANSKIKNRLSREREKSQWLESMLGECLQGLQSNFEKMMDDLRGWRASLYQQIDCSFRCEINNSYELITDLVQKENFIERLADDEPNDRQLLRAIQHLDLQSWVDNDCEKTLEDFTWRVKQKVLLVQQQFKKVLDKIPPPTTSDRLIDR